MKITKIKPDEESKIVTVWTDEIENLGFNFAVEELKDAEDLKKKLRVRINRHLDEAEGRKDRVKMVVELRKLEGQEI